MKALSRASQGETVNFCPFGCGIEELDSNGYCHHLIGFTLPGDETQYEPMVEIMQAVEIKDDDGNVIREENRPTGRRAVQVRQDEKGKPVYEKVRASDKKVRITVCSRVYRNVDKTQAA
jgi:hypothetical protein